MSKFDLGLLFNSESLVLVMKEKGSETVLILLACFTGTSQSLYSLSSGIWCEVGPRGMSIKETDLLTKQNDPFIMCLYS